MFDIIQKYLREPLLFVHHVSIRGHSIGSPGLSIGSRCLFIMYLLENVLYDPMLGLYDHFLFNNPVAAIRCYIGSRGGL